MKITFEHRDGWLQAKIVFNLPKTGMRAVPTFRWGKMGPAIGQIVAEWLNTAFRMSVMSTRISSYRRGYEDGRANRGPSYVHPDTLDEDERWN